MKNIIKKSYRTVAKIIIVFLVLIFLLLPTVFLNAIYAYLPILLAICLLSISGMYLMIFRRRICVVSNNDNAQCIRGSTVTVDMKVENKSLLLCPKAKAKIYISDYFGNDDSITDALFSLDSRSVTDFSFDIKMQHVGVYTAGIKDMRVYGLLGIFSARVPFTETFTVTVLPQINDYETELSDDLLTDVSDACSFSENDGSDYTGVREYAIGDSMKRIHWKLSAHSNNYMTKINEIGKKSDLTVILDMISKSYSDEELLDINDCLIENAASLLDQAEKKGIEYKLLFLDSSLQIRSLSPRTVLDYAELVREITPITTHPTRDMPDAEGLIDEEMQFQTRGANLAICTSRVTSGLITSLISIKNQKRSPLLYYALKHGSTTAEIKKASSELRLLEENDIYYKIID